MTATSWFYGGVLVALVAVLVVAVVVLARHRGVQHLAARTDPLTGLANRVALDERGTAAFASLRIPVPRGPRSHTGPAPHHPDLDLGPALLLLDLDGFKDVNDSLGHGAGDTLLVQVAQRLASAVRPGDLVARLGGDEFAVLAPAPVTPEEADRIGRTVLAALGAGGFTAGPEVGLEIGASIGIALAPDGGTSTSELLRHADLAMYEAKRSRSGVSAYRPAEADAPTDGHDRLNTLSLMTGAMEHDELVLHYQPVVDARTRELRGYEVLLRWQHPVRGMMLPQEFLPSAERTSLIRPLTRWVLLGATRQAAQWWAEGEDLTMAINLSTAMLEPGLLAVVEESLALSGFPAEKLVLEITGSALSGTASEARAVVTSLRALGLGISVDDFGAGSTGLSQLRGLDLTHLKIDKQFVTGMLAEPVDEAIAATIIDLGHRLGAVVIAEGVEDEAVARRLGELGCDHLQGYAVGHPVPAGEAEPTSSRVPVRGTSAHRGAAAPDHATPAAAPAPSTSTSPSTAPATAPEPAAGFREGSAPAR